MPYPPAPQPVPAPAPYPPYYPYPMPPMPGPITPGQLPFPPPLPPPIETTLIRQIVAERTVGGIKAGDVLPAGLSFTEFVEILLRGTEEIKTYLVVFNANGGSGTMQSQTFTTGVAQRLSANVFIRDGYEFEGWSTSPSGAVNYTDGASVQDLASAGGTITLYAVWKTKAWVFYFGAVDETQTLTEALIKTKDTTDITDSEFASGVEFTIDPDRNYMFFALIKTLDNKFDISAGGITVGLQDLITSDVTIDGVAYRVYRWPNISVYPCTMLIKQK